MRCYLPREECAEGEEVRMPFKQCMEGGGHGWLETGERARVGEVALGVFGLSPTLSICPARTPMVVILTSPLI